MGLIILFMINFYKQYVPNGTSIGKLRRSELFVEIRYPQLF